LAALRQVRQGIDQLVIRMVSPTAVLAATRTAVTNAAVVTVARGGNSAPCGDSTVVNFIPQEIVMRKRLAKFALVGAVIVTALSVAVPAFASGFTVNLPFPGRSRMAAVCLGPGSAAPLHGHSGTAAGHSA